MKIVVVSNDVSFRLSLVKFIKENLNHAVVEEYSSVSFLFEQNLNGIDILLLDISRNRSSILKTAKKIYWNYLSISILAIANKRPTQETIFKLVEIGIKGFIKKENIFQEFKTAINLIITDRYYYPLDILFPKTSKKTE